MLHETMLLSRPILLFLLPLPLSATPRLSSPSSAATQTPALSSPPDLISEYDMNFYYHGISGNPPKLLWRSNLESDPFLTPPPGTNFYKIPRKTAHGVFNTPINELWDDTIVP